MGLGPAQAERGWWRRFSPERACAARECAIAFLHSFPRLDPEPYVDPFARYNRRPHEYDESSIEHGPHDYGQPTRVQRQVTRRRAADRAQRQATRRRAAGPGTTGSRPGTTRAADRAQRRAVRRQAADREQQRAVRRRADVREQQGAVRRTPAGATWVAAHLPAGMFLSRVEDRQTFVPMDRFAPSIAAACTLSTECGAGARW